MGGSSTKAPATTRVLVVDDQRPILDLVADLLAGSFDVVGLVSDSRAAVEAVLTLEPDLVVLDISMPGMNGIDVARELARRASRSRIVFLTIHEDAQILSTCLAAGGLAYVLKPFMHHELIHAMNEALAGRVFVSGFSSDQRTI